MEAFNFARVAQAQSGCLWYISYMHTKEKGDISEAMVTAAFLRSRFTVLKPIGERHRFDLVIDRGNGFERVQCKSGRLRNGAICFATCSNMAHHGGGRKDYRGQVELFGVYCSDNDMCYLVPVSDVGIAEGKLRFDPSKNGQKKNVRLAASNKIP